MERLTVYDRLAGVMVGDLKSGIDERRAFDKLARYEDTGLEPAEIDSVFIHSVLEENKRLKSELEALQVPNAPITLEELREMDEPVWVECGKSLFTPNGGYYCLCQNGTITTPAGAQFNIEEIPKWVFYRRKPEEGTA